MQALVQPARDSEIGVGGFRPSPLRLFENASVSDGGHFGAHQEILAVHLSICVPNDPSALVFTTETGTHVWITSFLRGVWWPALDEAGISRVVTIKDLRQTCASLMHPPADRPKKLRTARPFNSRHDARHIHPFCSTRVGTKRPRRWRDTSRRLSRSLITSANAAKQDNEPGLLAGRGFCRIRPLEKGTGRAVER